MSDIEQVWREKSDEDLIEAAATLSDFTEEGQQVIRAELRRRNLEDPVEQAGQAARESATSEPEEGQADGAALPAPECIRCHVEMRYRGTRTVLGEVGHLFENSDAFDVYVCPQCGHVDLFVNEIGAEPAED
jgi:rubrerythrin